MESVKKFEVVWDGQIIFMVAQSDFDRETTGLEQRRYAEQQAREAAERRVDDLKGLLRRAKPYIPWSNFGSVPYQWNLEVQDALNPTAEAESHE